MTWSILFAAANFPAQPPPRCHLMAPPCTFIRCFNMDKQGELSKRLSIALPPTIGNQQGSAHVPPAHSARKPSARSTAAYYYYCRILTPTGRRSACCVDSEESRSIPAAHTSGRWRRRRRRRSMAVGRRRRSSRAAVGWRRSSSMAVRRRGTRPSVRRPRPAARYSHSPRLRASSSSPNGRSNGTKEMVTPCPLYLYLISLVARRRQCTLFWLQRPRAAASGES